MVSARTGIAARGRTTARKAPGRPAELFADPGVLHRRSAGSYARVAVHGPGEPTPGTVTAHPRAGGPSAHKPPERPEAAGALPRGENPRKVLGCGLRERYSGTVK
ncbi:hypothetical protein OH738_22890 [Streptomyces hirsutus]|uniref:Uncharacterized protein n=1 Tax=Streptomyces hirsutus TaxID=35620 RepID=A0ABZ1H211_9ACTN|nr:hypothetical protein [Streptomyces hirsutus]WSD11718.1 hypothetical protein OIE73_16750 [Streptomyces hirsutus]WTD22853.1 hypothetical protein OH738_22890 [Streptomyces hirsutus]WTD80129.1 hypothetical protein OHB56_18660 [Streptomyces sp. NBC_01635]